MSVEKEQFDKVMGELRRACLPAGGADAVQAYVDGQAKALFESELFGAVFVRLRDKVLADLVEAVALLRRARGPASIRAVDDDIDAFLARHEQNYQQGTQASRDPVLTRPEHGVSLDVALALTMDRYSGALNQLAVIEQQEAQGAQAGDERVAFERNPNFIGMDFSRAPNFPDYYESPFANGAWQGWKARAALATQPAVQEVK